MKVFFYHLDPIYVEYEQWKSGNFPGHLLYGLTHLKNYGLKCLYYGKSFNYRMGRWKLMLYNFWNLIFKYEYDVLYGITHRGLELIILLRALGLYRKPIVIWHHTAVVTPSGLIRRFLSRFFYRGIDKMFFFSNELLERSLVTGKVERENAFVVHWGADLDYYSRILALNREKNRRFISTGVENRDFVTLIKAMNGLDAECDIYTRPFMNIDYMGEVRKNTEINSNVHFNIVNKSVPEMVMLTVSSYCVLICCLNFPYTVGLTTLVEAMALGLPIIVTDNPTFEMDIKKTGAGLTVPYNDVKGWKEAIEYMISHPVEAQEMGRRARALCESAFNLEIMSREIADVLLLYKK